MGRSPQHKKRERAIYLGCPPGRWVEWSVDLIGDGPFPDFGTGKQLAWAQVWEHAYDANVGLKPGDLVDLYVVERRWLCALSFGLDNPSTSPLTKDAIVWPSATHDIHSERSDPLFEGIVVGSPLWVSTRTLPIRRVVSAGSPGPIFNDPLPEHGQDASAGGLVLGWLVNQNSGSLVVRVAKADMSLAGDVHCEVWAQSSTGLWSKLALLSTTTGTDFVVPRAELYRRIYPRFVGGTLAAPEAAYAELVPYTSVGHDFAADANPSPNASRIGLPYVRVRFGALVKGSLTWSDEGGS